MRRLAVAAALAWLAAAATPAAAKPTAGHDDPDRILYRMQGVAACIAAHPPVPSDAAGDGDLLADCQCAVERFIAGRDVTDLPRLVPGQDKGLLDEALATCRAERGGTSAPARPPGAAADPPAEAASPAAADGPKRRGFDPLAWFDGLDLPRWAWGAIPAAALLLFLLFRRRRRSDDLLGPPPSMRRSGPPSRPNWPVDRR